MKRKIYYLFSITIAALCCSACTDKEDGGDPSILLNIYGRQYQLASGVIWENNPNVTVSQQPYIFKDTYINASGQEMTDEVIGFTTGGEAQTTGNFLLSLYETGLNFNESLQITVGKAACICFHIASAETKELKPGKYLYGENKQKDTFTAYSSSDYNTENSYTPATIRSGEVSIEQNKEEYIVKFNCKTGFEGEIKGEYHGKLKQCKVALQTSAYYQNIALSGLMDTIIKTVKYPGGIPEKTISADISNGTAFLSTASGMTKFAKDGDKDLVDIALVWDKTKKAFYFEAPIRMRSLLGHNSLYNFPCHTVYMKAPDTFSDTDFEKLEETDFTFEIKEEKVWFDTDNFKPGYIFFKAGNGSKGVIRVKGFAPLSERQQDYYGAVLTSPVNPILYIDIKCPASFVTPKIR